MSVPAFLCAMAAAGVEPHGSIDLRPGVLVRFRVHGDKPGSKNGAAVYHDAPQAWGWFQSWRTGEAHTWRAAAAIDPSPAERAAIQKQASALRAARLATAAEMQMNARGTAARLWSRSRPASNDHPYLRKKCVHAFGIRRLRNALVIPVRDAAGELHSLQFIEPDGSKKFLTGGRVAGCYFGIGKPFDSLLLAEGLATASTLHMATGAAVACCFHAGNLLPVAKALRRKFPRLLMVVVADNDRMTPGNPGVTKAREAAAAVGGVLAVPCFDGLV
jgi:putative DNA primase/helicase